MDENLNGTQVLPTEVPELIPTSPVASTPDAGFGAPAPTGQTGSEKTKKKKSPVKWIVSAAALVVVVAGVLIGLFVIRPNVIYGKAEKLLQAGEYAAAIEQYEKISGKKDSGTKIKTAYLNYGKQLIEEGKASEGLAMLKKSGDPAAEPYVNYANAIVALQSNQFDDAITQFADMSGFEKSDEYLNQAYYGKAGVLYKDQKYAEAKSCYQKAYDYNDAKQLMVNCDFEIAEKFLDDGELAKAQEVYKTLPADFELDGKKAADRLALLDKYSYLVKICGTWTGSNGTVEVAQIYNRTGSEESWEAEYAEDAKLTVKCYINDDGSFKIKGTANFISFSNYSSLSSNLRTKDLAANFEKEGTTVPQELYNENGAILTYNSSGFHLRYDYTNTNTSQYFSYRFKSSIDYTKKQ